MHACRTSGPPPGKVSLAAQNGNVKSQSAQQTKNKPAQVFLPPPPPFPTSVYGPGTRTEDEYETVYRPVVDGLLSSSCKASHITSPTICADKGQAVAACSWRWLLRPQCQLAEAHDTPSGTALTRGCRLGRRRIRRRAVTGGGRSRSSWYAGAALSIQLAAQDSNALAPNPCAMALSRLQPVHVCCRPTSRCACRRQPGCGPSRLPHLKNRHAV